MTQTYLASNGTLAQLLGHQAIFNIRELRTILEMILGQKHIPNAGGTGLCLQVVENAWVAVPSCVAGPDLRAVDGLRRYDFFVDEFLDLRDW